MAYEQKPVRRQKILYNSSATPNKLIYQLVLDGAKVTPTSATVTIYSPSGTTALVGPSAMTVSGTLLTYAVNTTTVASWPIGEGYRAEIAITYGGAVYAREVMFDVVRWFLDVSLGFDQLVAYDSRLKGMTNGDDEDFSALIEGCRDDLQIMIESKMLQHRKLVENMILDHAQLSALFRLYVLAQLWHSKGSELDRNDYRERFESLFGAWLSTLNFDADQNGQEDGEEGGLQQVRLET